MSNKTYDTLKFVSLAIAPVVTLVTSVLAVLDVPGGAIITAIVAAVGTCVGELVVIAKKLYEDKQKQEEGGGNE